MDVGKFNGRRLYTGLRLDHRLRLWAPTSASRVISAVAELLVIASMLALPAAFCSDLSIYTVNRKTHRTVFVISSTKAGRFR